MFAKFLSLYCCCLLVSLNAIAQKVVIKGVVTSRNEPLENITIKVLGTKISTKSGSTGIYLLNGVPFENCDLVFSGIGYQSKKVKVALKGDTLMVNAEMLSLASDLNDVVITGVNRATQLRKSPVPIAVLSKKTMDQNVNTNLIEAIVKGVPGITAVTTGPNVSKPFIRGLGYNRVLTLYDGLRQEGQQWGDEHGIEVDEYGITRVEVVKGPASLTYGSDALAGVINMIPYMPNFEEGKLKGDFTTNYQRNNGMIGSSIGLAYIKNDWKYTFRVTGKTAHNYRNRVDGLVYGTAFREYNLSASARLDKTWGFSKTAITYYNNLMEIPDGSRDSLSRRFTRQVLDDGDDIKNRPIVADSELKTYTINPLHQHIQHYRFYNTSQFKFGTSDLNLLIGGQQSVRREYNHPTWPGQAGLYVVLNTFNYDLKYNLPDFAGIESTLGLNGMYQVNRSKAATDFPIPDYNLFDVGAFYFAKKSMGKVDVSGGIRIDRRNINWDNFYVGTNVQNGFDKQVSANDPTGKLQFPSFHKNYYGLSGSLGLTYNISEKFLIKANIARGYRAPNITEIGSNGLDPGAHIVYLGNRTFKPEFNLQQDIGIIAYLKDADISVELFNNNIQNYIYQSRLTDANGNPVVIVPGNLTYQYQQSKARLYGAEISINLHPTALKWLSFNNSLAYTVGLNQNRELLDQHGNEAKYLPFIPPLQVRTEIKATAQKPMGIFDKPYIKIDAAFFADQDRFYALDNTESFTAGYTLINGGIGSTLKTKKGKTICDIFLQADNIFNIAYQSNLNRLKYFEYYNHSPNGRSGIYNMGRNLSFKVIIPI
ncbi:iron complex outermembrane recepter protein [Pedobacter terrae]|uniref:Iron complex outermembrane recepter protein n=1 Tax=Pedobacter terrae TaxID=405671 RepID=A0A1G7WBN6_9SPHI|nr:TonB-dependent receptor [Pedobacter terrae]SDG69406.1 iron complex outermembrane recepter protein [Pedobacter terrae]